MKPMPGADDASRWRWQRNAPTPKHVPLNTARPLNVMAMVTWSVNYWRRTLWEPHQPNLTLSSLIMIGHDLTPTANSTRRSPSTCRSVTEREGCA